MPASKDGNPNRHIQEERGVQEQNTPMHQTPEINKTHATDILSPEFYSSLADDNIVLGMPTHWRETASAFFISFSLPTFWKSSCARNNVTVRIPTKRQP